MEVVEDLFGWQGWGARGERCTRRVVPVSRHADGFDFGCLSPFLDASRDEFWLRLAPDACSHFGFGDGLGIRAGLDWPDSGEEGDSKLGMGRSCMGTYKFRAGEMCWIIEMRRARLYDHEAFWRAERKIRRTTHPGSFTSSVATVESKQRTLRGGRRKGNELVMVESG